MAPSVSTLTHRRCVHADAVREQIRARIVDSRSAGAGKHAFDAPEGEITVRRWADDAVVVQERSAVEELVVHRVPVDGRKRTPE